MTVLDNKFRRDLVLSRGMLAAVIAIIAVGTGCFVGMRSTFDNLGKARTSYYSRCRMADFWVNLKKAPLGEVKQLLDLQGVSEVRDRIAFPVIVDLKGVERPISGHLLTLPSHPAPVLNNIVVERGSYFSAKRRNEVIISEKFARARNIEIGSYIHLVMGGQRKKLFVVGTAMSSEYMYLTPPGSIASTPSEYGLFYVKRKYAEDVFDFSGACNEVVGLLTPQARKSSEQVLGEIDRKLNAYGVFAVTPRSQQFSNLALSSEMKGLRIMAIMLPIIFLAVAALVLNVLMIRMIEQQHTIIGTLKAIGYSNRQMLFHFLKYGLFVGTFGGLAGCILGYAIAGGMTGLYRTLFEFPQMDNTIYPLVMLLAVAISVAFAVVGTLRGVKEVVRLNPAEAMRERMPAVGGRVFLERWQGLWSRLGFRWQMVLRGLLRNKIRSLVGIFAAAMGAALVLTALGMNDSLGDMVVFQFDKVLLSDYTLALKDEVDNGAWYEARRLPGVLAVEPLLDVPCTFYRDNHEKKGKITGILPGAVMTVPQNTDGQPVAVPPYGLLMTDRLAEKLEIEEGDMVSFVPVKGEKVTYQVPVVKIINTIFGLGVYANYHYLNGLIAEKSAISRLQLRTRQSPQQKIEFYRQLKKYAKLQSVSERKRDKASIQNDFVAKLQGASSSMIIFAAVIFFGSILNGSLIAISERRREIATFRVLGYQSREVGAIFLRENMLTNITGAIIGLPLGYGMLLGMMQEYRTDAYAIPVVVYPGTWVWTIALAVLFVLCSHVVVQRTIGRMDWNEALKHKE